MLANLFFLQDSSIKQIINCLSAKKTPAHYSEAIRSFALNSHSLGPQGYNYLREKFHNNLPHPSTIRKWYAKSNCNGEPGLSEDSLATLRSLVEEHKKENNTIHATISFDEVHIRRHVQWSDTKKKIIGNITYGSIPQKAEYLPAASNAIAFMVNGINKSFHLPVAFQFINCLQKYEKAALIMLVLRAVTQTGIVIDALVFDGLFGNLTTCSLLGASFNTEKNFQPYIINPITKEKIFIFLDAPHMIKLIRNCIGQLKTLHHVDGSKIEWKYYESLEDHRKKYDIVTHKLTRDHILFEKNIMNVRLATQLLSESVAQSMTKFSAMPQTKDVFKGCEATVEFTRKFNKLFDIFNSRESDCKKNIFKQPLTKNSATEIFKFFDDMTEYIKNLKLSPDDKSIIFSRRKTWFKGFIINMSNLKSMYEKYVATDVMKNIESRSLNQDYLENLFGRIRTAYLGNNDNPTVEQFCAAYRKTIVATELRCSTFANCVDQLNILHVSSSGKANPTKNPVIIRTQEMNSDHANVQNTKNTIKTNAPEIESISKVLAPEQMKINSENFDGSKITVSYLSGVIEKKIINSTRSNCTNCVNIMKCIFNENPKCDAIHVETKDSKIPCQSTINICQIACDCLQTHAFKINFNYNNLLDEIEKKLEVLQLYNQTNFEHNLEHKKDLIRYIIEEFVRIRATYLAQQITMNEQKKLLRRKNLKTVHFAGQ